jgi:hypothetical protein
MSTALDEEHLLSGSRRNRAKNAHQIHTDIARNNVT